MGNIPRTFLIYRKIVKSIYVSQSKENVALIDSGPIVALFNSKDKFHRSIYNFIKSYKGSLFSTWAVVTEVIYFLFR
ncbi:toxin-antitoxin system, toxin component, PIN domain protein [Leptospira kirschneri str. H2]|uniref:Toxin-antitoxin system, toxin component, PIN domain protein n=2 Tax=Leptospira kirschneri TaxID=29507 RepID=A0A0E2B5S0_9LEPT|nr:toxin-antitoxin system, toxin component, PIN domain protein [Leptospira kirschneri str. H1]EKO58633.1 toxin-antitoxin system, toxin component, PIN domain protein [Leptospira kirschneri str. H2]EMK25314.1 toxin-antitoxin system, toxin component, PIN domain protein [Leptospira kirschneri serovar Bulgarica str. Nikolaevo]